MLAPLLLPSLLGVGGGLGSPFLGLDPWLVGVGELIPNTPGVS